ncbi:MAG: T9SS type A sorting domain-containing protein, partial [Candidatus Latescibacterota bacterium]
IINDFDVITPSGAATIEMTYDGNLGLPAVVAFNSVNVLGNPVATVLSGFSFHSIRDDYPAGIPDRADHLTDIIRYLGNISDDPTEVVARTPYVNNLFQNYPNPFNPLTTIPFSLKEKGLVSIHVYNAAGQLVSTLLNEVRDAGIHTDVTWDSRSEKGAPLASGIYFYKLVTKGFTQARKLVLLK